MHGTRNQSKISGGGGGLVQFSYFMYVTCCRFALFKTFMPCFRWFQVVCGGCRCFLGGCRWFQVVLGRSMFQYANEHHPTIKFIVEISVSEATLLETSIYKGERFNSYVIIGRWRDSFSSALCSILSQSTLFQPMTARVISELYYKTEQSTVKASLFVKSSIKTKAVLTMTDMTESTELLAFKR